MGLEFLSFSKHTFAYWGVLAGCFVVGTLAGWTALAERIDHYAYDLMTAATTVSVKSESVVVAIDEDTFHEGGGPRNIRKILTTTLEDLATAEPKAVALDVLLADKGDEAEDARLEAALHRIHNLVLGCDLLGNRWEDPLPRFAAAAVGVGHVHSEVDRVDGVSREISLEETVSHQRRWALSLEAFRIARGQAIVESPEDIEIGATRVPAPRSDGERPMLIRYLSAGITRVPALKVKQNSALLRGKTVFVGVTALSAAVDRLLNPYGVNVPGVEVHAHAFETMARGDFLRPAGNLAPLAVAAGFTIAAGLAFAFLGGWAANGAALAILIVAHTAPVLFFREGIVFPYFAPAAVAWLANAGAATFQHFFVRRQLQRSEQEKSRYQQAIHWAAHEMRTPLTAIQGSSEIMSHYTLPEAKQKELSEMINSESKRLARLIQTFLDVERLGDGQMELKQETFAAADVVGTCVERVRPLAERKRISVGCDRPVEGILTGDRELMEYALYNLLTNAVKYSPAGTNISVSSEFDGKELRLAVRDQGMGMDSGELKHIFQKFYRTQRAEQSGEMGTGIGLSIVEQIVTHHKGRMEVTSEPGRGSCFTMVLRAKVPRESVAETSDRRG